MDYFSPVSLHGTRVSLVPLSYAHDADLERAGADPAIWRWMPSAHCQPGSMRAFIRSALGSRDRRLSVPFATLDKVSARAIGSTRFHFIEPEHRRLEIGVTWIGSDYQRSHVNTEAKLLQMWFAFDVLGCRRVEWKADAENLKSRVAIARLGAREEGYFRKHMLYPDGRNRDSAYFALIDDEWPAARARLEARLGYGVEPTYTIAEASDDERARP